MKTVLMAALIAFGYASPSLLNAQATRSDNFNFRTNDATGMVLLPGPLVLSPAGATGRVVAGQLWNAPKPRLATFTFRPVSEAELSISIPQLTDVHETSLTKSPSGSLTISSGKRVMGPQLTVRPSGNTETLPELQTKLSRHQ
jgi:hypothetical protein